MVIDSVFNAASAGGVVFHAATGRVANAIARVQAQGRRRLPRVFVRRGRLLRHCARPPFALDRLRELAPERLVYDHPKPGPGAGDALILTPLQLLDRLGTLVSTP